jgi:hypothetical protein
MDFKTYYEGVIKVPTEYINQYVLKHVDEIISKINDTLINKYENYIEENLKINNSDIPLIIQNDINPPDSYLSYQNDNIYMSAKNLKSLTKDKPKFVDFLNKSLVHEVTHLMDAGLNKKPQYKGSDNAEYVNSPREFPAFVNMYIEKIKSLINSNPKYKNLLINAFKTGSSVKDREIDKFIKMLTPDNKIKFINNVLKSI